MVATSSYWTVPNGLTVLRLFLCFLLFYFFSIQEWQACLVLFVVAVITDFLDGWIARRWNQHSPVGRFLDPLADKLLILGCLVCFLNVGITRLPGGTGWTATMVAIMFGRELAVTLIRTHLEMRGRPFGADAFGKAKMVFQSAAVFWVFMALSWSENTLVPSWVCWLRDGLNITTVVLTLVSGIHYVSMAMERGVESHQPKT